MQVEGQHFSLLGGKNLFNYPACFLVDDYGVLIVRISLVAERSVGKNSLTVCKLGVPRGLDLAACVFRKPLISSLRIKHDSLTGRYAR